MCRGDAVEQPPCEWVPVTGRIMARGLALPHLPPWGGYPAVSQQGPGRAPRDKLTPGCWLTGASYSQGHLLVFKQEYWGSGEENPKLHS